MNCPQAYATISRIGYMEQSQKTFLTQLIEKIKEEAPFSLSREIRISHQALPTLFSASEAASHSPWVRRKNQQKETSSSSQRHVQCK